MTPKIETNTTVPVTSTGIPIRNLWHMILYAWKEVPLNNRWKVEIERSPSLDALLASILIDLVRQRLRIGLGRSYINESRLLRGIRGRIDFATSLRRLAFENGQAQCRFQEYSINVPKNQILRSTFMRLVQVGEFGPECEEVKDLKRGLRRLLRDLDGIDITDLSLALIHQQQFGRNDGDYRLMLAICELILQRHMPTEWSGRKDLSSLERASMTLHSVYERFVANFYTFHLKDWSITSQKHMSWHECMTSQYLPVMKPDLVLQHKSTKHMILLDTKFTAKSLISGRFEKLVFDSSHIYQLYAYLRSQEHLSEDHRIASGILLYPAVGQGLSEEILLGEHSLRFVTIDLAQPWMQIEESLKFLISGPDESQKAVQ